MGYRWYIIKEYVSAFLFNMFVYMFVPLTIFSTLYLGIMFIWNALQMAIGISSIFGIISLIINCVVLSDSYVLKNAGKFDPIDKETWKKQEYEKSFNKLTT